MADTEDSRKRRRAASLETARKWQRTHPEWSAFVQQRVAAKKRKIAFLFSFAEWWSVWEASGKWEQRGKRKGQYCMSRFGDSGPYAVDNVHIQLFGDNISQAHLGKAKSIETRLKMSKPKSAETRAKMSLARRKRGPISEETRRKMSRPKSEEARRKMSEAAKARRRIR